jgi:Flp pilus assembly protein TadD
MTQQDIDTILQRAAALYGDGEPLLAETECRRALTLNPKHPGALTALGFLLHQASRFGEAEETYTTLTDLEPQNWRHWMNLGTARRGLADIDGALRAYLRASELGAATADFFYNVGLAHLDRHDYESARAVLRRASELAPHEAAIRLEYAKACYESLQTEEAIAALAGWENFEGLGTEHLAAIGHRLMNLGESARAEQAIRQLAATRDLDPQASLTLAQILERTNRLDDARELIARLSSDPRAASLGADLQTLQAQLAQRDGQHERAAELFGNIAAKRSELHMKHFELFALAKSLDALKRYDDAFAAATEAHRSQVEWFKLTAPLATARGTPSMTITEYRSDPQDVATWAAASGPSAAESPIFIVAFPRSGTTLMELTLDAHPDLVSMDEQALVQASLDDLLATGIRYPEQLGKVSESQLANVRARYWERARTKVKIAPGQRLVDKNPLNLMRLPAIRRVFPNAKIVLAVRHPCDVLLSCYMQHFRAPDFALLCSNLDKLASGYRKTFDFWYRESALLKPDILEVRYESFVADFDAGTRALLAFLDVPWNDAVLAPGDRARQKGYISTPSYSQVVQPVNQKAVGRWKNYATHLQPVLPHVRPYLDRWGYAA